MQLETLFRTAIEAAFEADPRGTKGVQKFLERERKRQEKLEDDEKHLADPERLWNPYADSRILVGDGSEQIQHLLVGIDIETPEILLAERLKQNGTPIDAIMIHHPEGRALGDIDQVMDVQVEILGNLGVPVQKSESMMKPRREKIYRRIHAMNLLRTQQAAEHLGLPIFCCHNPADHLVAQFVRKRICEKEYDSLKEIIKALKEIEEYNYYAQRGNPPIIAQGSPDSRPGKVAIFGFNGGTNGPSEFIEELSNAGVGTFLSMHISDDDRKKAKECNINVIQCSHMASDTLGMNLVLDVLQKKDPKLKVTNCSGFIRVKR